MCLMTGDSTLVLFFTTTFLGRMLGKIDTSRARKMAP
jgi:hypothetical protein